LREENSKAAQALRDELTRSTTSLREAVDQKLRELQTGNEAKLDEMRRTVDENLHETLEKRLGESFRTVSVQLEAVHKGLGEMQTLASGVGAERASADLARAVRKCAQDIRDKYLDPPNTSDFGILFLPTEGLFAEVLRHPGLAEELQQKFRVIASGPTTLAATLSSLRMG